MDIYSRYLFKQTLTALMMILGSLSAVMWLATALSQLKLMTSQGQSIAIFATMTALSIPSLMAMIAPIALLISCLHTLNRLNNDSEIIVMSAAGATVWKVTKPLLLLSFIVTAAILVVNFYVQPKSLQLLRQYITQVRTDLISQVLQPGDFSSPEKGLTFHIRERSRNGDMLGLLIQDERDTKQFISYLAEKAVIFKEGDKALIVMTNGQIQRRTFDDKPKTTNISKSSDIQQIAFDRYVFDLNQFGEKQQTVLKPRERFVSDLINPPKTDVYGTIERFRGRLRVELHERISTLFYPALYVMIVAAFLAVPRTTRQGRIRAVISAIVLAVLVRVLGLVFLNLTSKHAAAVPLVYILPLASIVIATYTAHTRMAMRRETRFGHGFATFLRPYIKN